MKVWIPIVVLACCWFAVTDCAAQTVTVQYTAFDLGGGRWEYQYEVANHAQANPIVESLTIWFAYGAYDNLAVTTPFPPAGDWDELVVQPEPLFEDDGFYDVLALDTGIDVGQVVSGFAVSFDWLGQGVPGPQPFDVNDPNTFQPVFSGLTVPEPGFLLTTLAMLPLLRRRR